MIFLAFNAACVIIDILTFVCARDVLKDFLRGAIGKNKAKKKWSSITAYDRIFLRQLKIFCDEGADLLKKYYSVYIAFIFSLLPKYLTVVLVQAFYSALNNTVVLIIGIAIFLLTDAFFLVFRIPQLPHGKTKFIHYRCKR